MMNTLNQKSTKIGSRILSKIELEKLLPNYEKIYGQIDYIREVASKHNEILKRNDNNIKREQEFNKHHNNIISLLGERGSGKTSVLFTMKDYLMSEHSKKTDMFMPVMIPESMDKSSDVLGWLIGFFNDIVDDIEKDLNRDGRTLTEVSEVSKYFENCKLKDNNLLRMKFRELQKSYLIRTKEYKEIIRDNFGGISEYIKSSNDALEFDQKLMKTFNVFWEELLLLKRKVGKDKDVEPLLFIFFDDVDISNDRCYEILNTAIRFLSYPNIVLFIAGDYQTFTEILTIEFLKKDGLLGTHMHEDYYSSADEVGKNGVYKAIELRKRLAHDYLLKVLPPALRYYMPKYTNEMKVDFTYISEEEVMKRNGQNNKANSSNKETSNSVEVRSLTLYDLIINNFISKETDKFLLYEKDQKLYSYFKIFADNPRGLINVYYFLDNQLTELANNESIEQVWDKDSLKHLLSVIVDSSNILNKYKNEIYEIINIETKHINYAYILMLFEKHKEIKENKIGELIDEFVTIFILANFFENLIKMIFENRRNIHGYKEFLKILNGINNDFIVYPNFFNDIKPLLKFYELISKQKIDVINKKADSENYFLVNYFKVIKDLVEKITKDNYYEFFKKMYRVDEKWTKEKIDIIFKYGSRETKVLIKTCEETFGKLKEICGDKIFIEKYKLAIDNEAKKFLGKSRELKKLIEDDLRDNVSNKKREELEKGNIEIVSELFSDIKSFYVYQKELNSITEKINYNIKKPTYYSKKEKIKDLIATVEKKIRLIGEKLDNEESLQQWTVTINDGSIERVSFTKGDTVSGKDLVEFDPNTVEEFAQNKNLLEGIRSIISSFGKGYLKINAIIPETYKEFLIDYFNSLETKQFLNTFLLKELKAMLRKINLYNENSGKLSNQKVEELQSNICDYKMKILDNLKKYDLSEYENARNQEIDINYFQKKLLPMFNEKLIYKQINDWLPDDINFNSRSDLERLIAVYEKVFSDLRQMYSHIDMKTNSMGEFNKALNYITNINIDEIKMAGEKIKKKMNKIGKITRIEWLDFIDKVTYYLSLKENIKYIERSSYGDYIHIKEYIDEMRYNLLEYDTNEDVLNFQLNNALNRLDLCLSGYIQAVTLLGIIEKGSSMNMLQEIKHSLIKGFDDTVNKNLDNDTEFFNLYLNSTIENSIRVDLGV